MLIGTTMMEELKEEKYILNLLKHVFWAEPNIELMQNISKIEPLPVDDETDKGLNLLLEAVKKNANRLDDYRGELAIEFARLFIGPKNPPSIPYASFYLSESKTMMSNVTINVRKKYLDAGMAVKNLYSIPDDHIGIELEFIHYLTEKIIDSFEQGQKEQASRLFEMREDFMKGHFSHWVPEFANRVIASTGDDFYRGAGICLKGCFSLISASSE